VQKQTQNSVEFDKNVFHDDLIAVHICRMRP